jgi:rfaE bifunctional protein nucleotidyltransferase chain/domain
LKESKNKGNILVVALNSDSSVRQLKGAERPILFEQERAEIISSFYFVDYVTFFNERKVDKVLLTLKPHVHAKGSDYSVDTVPERETVKKYGGETAITGGPKIKSTSEVIAEIAAKFKNIEDKGSS